MQNVIAGDENVFAAQHKRDWNIDTSRRVSKAHLLKYVGRYIRDCSAAAQAASAV
jgi:hypothetical protein